MPMDAEQKFEHWLKIAKRDLRSASILLKSRQWTNTIFMSQQAIEKLVKGLYLLYINDNIPKIYNISKLIMDYERKLPSKIPVEYFILFDKLSAYYLNNRYPDYKNKLYIQTVKQTATEILTETKEAFKWLLTMKP
jgi:HEPN domain-containing protein